MMNCSASLTMSTGILEALPGKLDIKRHSPSILYISPHFCLKRHFIQSYANTISFLEADPLQLHIKILLCTVP